VPCAEREAGAAHSHPPVASHLHKPVVYRILAASPIVVRGTAKSSQRTVPRLMRMRQDPGRVHRTDADRRVLSPERTAHGRTHSRDRMQPATGLRCPECGLVLTPRPLSIAPLFCPRCLARRRRAIELEAHPNVGKQSDRDSAERPNDVARADLRGASRRRRPRSSDR
jgi:hypothetical protein